LAASPQKGFPTTRQMAFSSRFGPQIGSSHEAPINCSLRVLGRISTFLHNPGFALFLKPMDIGACQLLPACVPVKPTQVPLQVPAAAAKSQRMRGTKDGCPSRDQRCFAEDSPIKWDRFGSALLFPLHGRHMHRYQTIASEHNKMVLEGPPREGSQQH
jgi:hypothetical protein